MVGAAGIEPATLGLEIRCSIRLSYAPGKTIGTQQDYTWLAVGAAGLRDTPAVTQMLLPQVRSQETARKTWGTLSPVSAKNETDPHTAEITNVML